MKHKERILQSIKNGTFDPIMVGEFDRSSRFFIHDEYHTTSSRAIRWPSRAWPYSQYKHAFTKKYQKQLKELLTQ